MYCSLEPFQGHTPLPPSCKRLIWYKRPLAAALLMVFLEPMAWAQQPAVSELPGYFPFEELGILERDELSLEVNLTKSLLRLVAATTRAEEPEFSELVASLDAVRVRVAPADDVDLVRARKAASGAAGWLEDKNWQVVVRSREDDEEVFIYTRELDGEIAGMAIVAIEDGGEVAVINIVGRIDLSQLERLGEAFDLPMLGLPEPSAKTKSTQEPSSDDNPP